MKLFSGNPVNRGKEGQIKLENNPRELDPNRLGRGREGDARETHLANRMMETFFRGGVRG